MPTVLHPRALDSVDGSPAHRVVINRNRYNIDQETGLVEVETEQEATELADAYDVPRSAIDPAELEPEPAEAEGESEADGPIDEATFDIGRGVCPWCDDYEGDHVGQHASNAHPDSWSAYKDD